MTKNDLSKKIATIKEYKSIKKDADENLKPLEQEVKAYMEENGLTKFIGYGYSISYEEQERETVIKEKVLALINNPKIQEVIKSENIEVSELFKTTIVRPLKIN